MNMKVEGRTQLVGYAVMHRLVDGVTKARQMPLDTLRSVVELHRKAVASQNKKDSIDDASLATTAKEKDRDEA
jgi:hypothetical protein